MTTRPTARQGLASELALAKGRGRVPAQAAALVRGSVRAPEAAPRAVSVQVLEPGPVRASVPVAAWPTAWTAASMEVVPPAARAEV